MVSDKDGWLQEDGFGLLQPSNMQSQFPLFFLPSLCHPTDRVCSFVLFILFCSFAVTLRISFFLFSSFLSSFSIIHLFFTHPNNFRLLFLPAPAERERQQTGTAERRDTHGQRIDRPGLLLGPRTHARASKTHKRERPDATARP